MPPGSSVTFRLAGVVIEHRPALEVIAQQDSAETLFYIDPPYPHATRNMRRGNAAYAHEMNDADHAELAQLLHELKGLVIISGYRCALYDGLYAGWERREVKATADGRQPRVEVLWLNPQCASRQQQTQLFDNQDKPG